MPTPQDRRRQAGRKPDNAWQRATALGRRLGVITVADRVTWTHPDRPDVLYTVGPDWCALSIGGAEQRDPMDPATAEQYRANAHHAEPRRLAAWRMLDAIALESTRW